MLVGISRLLLRRPPPLPPPSAPLRTFFSIDPISVPSPIPLLPLDPALYTVASDAYLGGLSSGTIEKIEEDGREFIRFEGETVTRVPEVTKNTPDGNAVVRAGYVTFQVPPLLPSSPFSFISSRLPGGLSLNEHDTIEIDFRSSHPRSFILNLHVDSYIPHEVYQGYIVDVPASDSWATAEIPFASLLLTSHGQVKETQRVLDNPCIVKWGITCADGQDGRFGIDIREVRAVCTDEDYESEE